MQTTSTTRLNHLDAVRAFALLLGVVFHASLSFMPMFIGWAVMDVNTSGVVPLFVLVSHSFRLEVFFLIAGFFAHLSFHRQTRSSFLKSRLLRIGLPFVLFGFLLKPLIETGWIIGMNSYLGDLQLVSSLHIAYQNLMANPFSALVGSHLWFLHYLLVMTLSMMLLRTVFGLSPGLSERMGKVCDAALHVLVNKKLALPVFIGPTVICLWFMSHWGVDTPDRSLFINLPVFALYFSFFGLGWCLHRVPDLFRGLTKLTWAKTGLMLLTIVACVLLSRYEAHYGHPQYVWLKLSFNFSYATMMWALVLLFVGVCERLFANPNAVVRYLADSSYWMYLIHLPLVVFLQVVLSGVDLFWWLKLIVIVSATVLISLLSYDAFVRSTLIGAMLNGKRKPRVLFVLNRQGLAHEAS